MLMKNRLAVVVLMIFLGIVLIGCAGGEPGASDAEAVTTTKDTFLKSISTTLRTVQETDGVAASSCNSDEIIVGGGGTCSGYASESRAGYLFACEPVGNSMLCGCYSFDVQTYTDIDVTAICAKSTTGEAVVSATSYEDKISDTIKRFEKMQEEYNQIRY